MGTRKESTGIGKNIDFKTIAIISVLYFSLFTFSNTNIVVLAQEPSNIVDGIISEGEYNFNITLADGDYILYWSNFQNTEIYIGIVAKTNGWVSLGINPTVMMLDADMIFGFVEGGQVSVFDLFSTGDFGPHPEDTQLGGTYDIIEFGGIEQNGITSIEFKRELSTNDEYDNSLSKGSNKIIWSFGQNDDLRGRHTVRGYGEIILDY